MDNHTGRTAPQGGQHRPHAENATITEAKPVPRPWKVAAVIPCFNRRQDLELILKDVARQNLKPVGRRPIQLWCVVVDNASTQPLSSVPVPEGLRVEFVRLDKNSGGSGGFNAGMGRVLSGGGLTGELGAPDFLWWLDSDARANRNCLRELVKVLARNPGVGGVGSSMGDLSTGQTWECGAIITKGDGYIRPMGTGDVDQRFLVKADYLAACSGLVRRVAIEKTGLFPDNFIYYDDIDWCIQMTQKTGLKIVGAPRSRAWHPPGNRRYVTWGRYYIARNCFSHVDAMGLGAKVRFVRALKEVPRAIAQCMMGIDELAELHLKGLRDARDRNFVRIEPKDVVKPLGFKPYSELANIIETERNRLGGQKRLYVHPLLQSRIPGFETFRKELRKLKIQWPADKSAWRKRNLGGHVLRDFVGAGWRLLTGPTAEVALVPTGWPSCWFRGRVLVQVTTEGLIVREVQPWAAMRKALGVATKGAALAWQIARRGPHVMPLPPAPAFRPGMVAAAADLLPAVTASTGVANGAVNGLANGVGHSVMPHTAASGVVQN